MIMKESQHLARLIDNVLCYARITDTTSEYDLEVVDVSEVAQESLDRFAPQLRELGFEVQLQVPAEPALVRADALMLGQVFDNLVDNALKYAKDGRWVGVTVASDGDTVRIEVADRGPGVPPDERGPIFEKFYRRKGTRLRGAGLGLAIVRRIVEDHRGTVDVIGQVGQGSTFVVRVPRASA